MTRFVVAAVTAALLFGAGAGATPARAQTPPPEPGGWVLDAWGGLHPFNGAPTVIGTGWWPGHDLSRGLAVTSDGTGGWVLDAYGGLHEFGTAPPVTGTWYAPGQDLARGLSGDDAGGYVVDAYGGLHPYGAAVPVASTWYAPGHDLVRGIVANSHGGWVLDASGALHEFGDAPPVAVSWTAPGQDLARGAALSGAPGGGGWVVDAFGGLHEFGGAPPTQGFWWTPSYDLVRGVVSHAEPTPGGWVLDSNGGLTVFGSARSAIASWHVDDGDMARGVGASTGSSGARSPVPAVRREVTYDVRTTGPTRSSAADLSASARDTYADGRGWRAAGVRFIEVAPGTRSDFTLWLATPDRVEAFSSVCSAFYSCRVGRNVIINDDRFTGGSPYWPGSVDDYRDLVVNHETGHWLGFGHASCPAPGAPAPVMMQQSKGLAGCAPNPWPTASELAALR